MGHHEQPASKSAKQYYQKPLRVFWIVLYFLGGLAAVVVMLWLISFRLNTSISDPVQFITGNLLNALIFAAIVAQVLIYRQQKHIMDQQWQAMIDQLKATQSIAQVSVAGSRPYLDINATLMFLPDDPIKIEVNFINNGQSEAAVTADYEIIIQGSLNARKPGSFKPFFVAPTKYETKRIGKISFPELDAIQQYTARVSLRIQGSYSGLGAEYPIDFCKTYAKHRGMATSINHLPLAQACEDEDA